MQRHSLTKAALGWALWGALVSGVQAEVATRASSFEYDPNSGLLTRETIEPAKADLCLRTDYAHDRFGNKTSATTKNCTGVPRTIRCARA